MTARTVRGLASVLCIAGVAGMIASAVAASTGAALTFGLMTATAVLCSIVATTVTGSRPAPVRRGDPCGVEAQEGIETRVEDVGDVEDMVRRLVEAGAEEADVRELVARAKTLGQATNAGRRRSTHA